MLVTCNREPESSSILDQSSRTAQDEGEVTEVTLERIILDNDRSYEISPKVESFLASSKKIAPILSTDNRYVQLGLDSSKVVVWISTVGVIARTEPPAALYSGVFIKKDSSGRAVFKDGTVLKVASGVDFPRANKKVAVKIDPARHEITEFVGS